MSALHHYDRQPPRETRCASILRTLLPTLLFGAAFALWSDAYAQARAEWRPNQPIKIIVPFAPGGGTDSASRLLAEDLGRLLGQSVIIENKPGASGLLAINQTFAATPDGYTLMMGTSATHATTPHLFPAAAKEVPAMVPVASVATIPVMLVGKKALTQKTAKAFLDAAKTKEMTYAHYGIGSAGQIAMELIKTNAGIEKMLGVPYKGGGPALLAVLSGEVDAAVVPVNSAISSADRLILFGTVSDRRPAGVENVPTLREQGYDVAADAWVGLFAPPGTPAPVVDAISAAVRQIVGTDELASRLRPLGLAPLDSGSPTTFAAFVRKESVRYGAVIERAGIKPEN